jgi:predicted GIY-YIG superfamily endonuclease
MVGKKAGKGNFVKAYAEGIGAKFLESHKVEVDNVVGRKSGLYVLTKNSKPYYVGLASNLHFRIGKHLKDRLAGRWDRFSFYSIPKQKYLKDVETILVRVAEPKANKQKGSFGKHRNKKHQLKREIIQSVKRNF